MKIAKIHYEETDADLRKSAEFYFYHNLINVHDMFHKPYEASEIDQMVLKQKLLGRVVGEIDGKIKLDQSMLAVSSLKNKVVLIS